MFPLPSELEALSHSYQFYGFSTSIHTLITQSCSRTSLLSKVGFFGGFLGFFLNSQMTLVFSMIMHSLLANQIFHPVCNI